MSEEQIDIDPLFIAMTRLPLTMGVPMEFFGINFIIFGVGMILFMSLVGKILFFVCLSLPLHAIAYVATEKDANWMRVWLTKLNKCSPTRNKRFWKSNSYQP
jgi:type IV secretory pathway VirB3-like protein